MWRYPESGTSVERRARCTRSCGRRRFGRSISNFFAEYLRLADSWYLFDNSGGTPTVIAFKRAGKPRIMNREQYEALIARYGNK
jgi:predicted ABC-type ATPase